MCPTELSYDPSLPPSIRLLPIETRLHGAGIAEIRNYADEWTSVPLDLAAPDRMGEALRRVAEVKRVPAALAADYGLHDDGGDAAGDGGDGTLEIPCWRHAIINFPHPLLLQGLVVLDTPGLNALGIEPELTLNQLAEAHAVLFVLAADTGVTRTDLDLWTRHLAGDADTAAASRIVVLNKIDGLWDELRQRFRRRRRDPAPGRGIRPRARACRRRRCTRSRRRRRWWRRSTATTRCWREAACRRSSRRCRAR